MTTDDELLGRVLAGAYRLESVLGRGAMGVVYRARHEVLDQDFAVKVIAPDVAEVDAVRARLLQEAQTLGILAHRNIVAVRHCGEEDGLLYVVMDHCAGETLRTTLEREGALPESRVVEILRQVLAALEEAHGRGIVHRDLKPDNIMIGPPQGSSDGVTEHVSVLDFGLARILDEARVRMPGAMVSAEQHVVGTVAYMSPEQIRATTTVDGRSDLFSLGVVAYEMLAGKLPFHSEDSISVMMRILESQPPPLPEKGPEGVSRPLRAVVVRALMKNPDDRFQSAANFAAALRGDLDPRQAGARTAVLGADATPAPEAARPRRALWGIGIVALAVIAATAWFLRDDTEERRAHAHTAAATCAWRTAVDHLDAVVRAGDATGVDHLALARARIALRDPKARAALEDAAQQLGADDPNVLLEQARFAYFVTGDFQVALERVGAAAAAEGAGIDPLLLRIRLLRESGPRSRGLQLPRPRQAMLAADLASLERRAPDDARTLQARGAVLGAQIAGPDLKAMTSRAREAVALLERAAAVDPQWGEPLMDAANALSVLAAKARVLGHAEAGVAPLERALQLADEAMARVDAHPHHRCQADQRADLLHVRALVRLHAGKLDEGIEDVRTVYALRKDLSAFRALADRLRTSGRMGEAIALYERLTEATQDRQAWFDLGFCHRMTGREHAHHGRFAEARAAYERAVKAYEVATQSTDASAIDHAYLGEALTDLAATPGVDPKDLLTRAGKVFDAARAKASSRPSSELEHRRAVYLCATGQAVQAMEDLTNAIAHDEHATPAMRARLARVIVCRAIQGSAAGEEFEALLTQAGEQIDFVEGMIGEPTVGLLALRADLHQVGAWRHMDPKRRLAHLEAALAAAQAAEAKAAGTSPWSREGLEFVRRHLELQLALPASIDGPKTAPATMMRSLRMGRPALPELEALAGLLEAQGDTDTAGRVRTRIRRLRGES